MNPADRAPDAFAALADDLRALAQVLNNYMRDGDPSVPRTRAAEDWEAEAALTDDALPRPVGGLLMLVLQAMGATIDHMLGIAACIEADRVVFSIITLMRPAIVASGVAHYLLAPDIDLAERLRRSCNIQLVSLSEQLHGIDSADMRSRLTGDVNQILRWAEAHGFASQSVQRGRNAPEVWRLTDDSHTDGAPSEMQLARAVFDDLGPTFGHAAYRFMSAFVHSQPHAFTLLANAPGQVDPQTPGAIPQGISLDDASTWVLAVVLAADAAFQTVLRYLGWDGHEWQSIFEQFAARWGY